MCKHASDFSAPAPASKPQMFEYSSYPTCARRRCGADCQQRHTNFARLILHIKWLWSLNVSLQFQLQLFSLSLREVYKRRLPNVQLAAKTPTYMRCEVVVCCSIFVQMQTCARTYIHTLHTVILTNKYTYIPTFIHQASILTHHMSQQMRWAHEHHQHHDDHQHTNTLARCTMHRCAAKNGHKCRADGCRPGFFRT